MDFLNRLYESNYFGIGLFAVISFLVVTFLVVLFFGKKDEQKRKLDDNTNSYAVPGINDEPAFRETSVQTPVEVPVSPVEPVQPVENVVPINTVQDVVPNVPMPNVDIPVASTPSVVTPVAPVQPIQFEEPVPVSPVINEPTPIIPNVASVAPVVPSEIESTPVINTPVEPIRVSAPVQNVEPTVMEPVKIDIPVEPTPVSPIINEPAPIIPNVAPVAPIVEEPTIIDEPVINDTYYKPVENVAAEEVKVPNIDFDALAKTISAELDELEKNNTSKITPISEVTNKPTNQFSSVYVNNAVKTTSTSSVDLPKKIDLPTKKD